VPNLGKRFYQKLLVVAEKILAKGEHLGHVAGIALVTAGVALMARLW